MKFGFAKTLRLRTRRDYKRMSWQFIRHEGKFSIVDAKNNYLPETRLGITVSRHYGNAPSRNRFKRIVREAFRLCRYELLKGLDINVRPRRGVYDASIRSIQNDLIKFFAKSS